MHKKQRENTAKYLYDISKIIFATVVIGQLIQREKIQTDLLASGIIACLGTYFIAFLLDRMEDTK